MSVYIKYIIWALSGWICIGNAQELEVRTSDEDTFEYQIEPQEADNFSLSLFRLWVPRQQIPLRGVLIVLPGSNGDSLNLVDCPEWRNICASWGFGCLTVVFTSNQSRERYSLAQFGSGSSVVAALEQLSTQSRRPELQNVPIAILGHSEGGIFAYNFACWLPSRVIAFATIKGGYYDNLDSQAKAIPGLIIAGALDNEYRLRRLRELFDSNAWPSSKWAYLCEPHSGHRLDNSLELVVPFFDAVIRNKIDPYVGSIAAHAISPVSLGLAGSCAWFPNKKIALIWQKIMKGEFKEKSFNLEIPSSPLKEIALISKKNYDFGRISCVDAVEPAVIHIRPNNGFRWTSVRASSSYNRTTLTITPSGPEYIVSVTPIVDPASLGRCNDTIQLRFFDKGRQILGGSTIEVNMQITHPDVEVTPSTLYAGAYEKETRLNLRLFSPTGKKIALSGIEASPGGGTEVNIVDRADSEITAECRFFSLPKCRATLYGKLSISLELPIKTKIVVPYIGFCKTGTDL